MIDISKGRYWDEGITLVDGCTPCSPGCDHCWSAGQAHRFYREGEPGHESGIFTDDKGRFNGDIMVHPDRLKRFNTRKPKVFAIWNDLFHEAVSFDFILATLIHAVGRTDNKYLILTKRPQQAVRFFNWMEKEAMRTVEIRDGFYFGLTVCNQSEWDDNKDSFISIPSKKFISHEPALGAIVYGDGLTLIDGLLSGGETGTGARPSHPDIFRKDREQCAFYGVDFFFKQCGEWIPMSVLIKDGSWVKYAKTQHSLDTNGFITEEYRPRACSMYRVGRNKACRLLDGKEHNELPWRKA